MPDIQEEVSVPQGSATLAAALSKLFLDVYNAQKSGDKGLLLLTDIITASVKDLSGALGAFGVVGQESALTPLGVVEAFTISGLEVARQISGK